MHAFEDGAPREIYADGVDFIEVVGSMVKVNLFSTQKEKRRVVAVLIMPWQALPGGLVGLRKAFGDRMTPAQPRMTAH